MEIFFQSIFIETADLQSWGFMGCDCHILNLAVEQLMLPFAPALASLDTLMSKLNTVKLAARLRKVTDKVAIHRNSTRWSSTGESTNRFAQIRGVLDRNDIDLIPSLPSPHHELEIVQLNYKLSGIFNF